MTTHRHTLLVSAAVSAIIALFVGGGAVAWANHQFPDVPTSSPFHDDIATFVDAGCASGFPDNTFRPQDPVKRQQMARFFAACGGRVETDETSGPVALSPGGGAVLADVTIDAGAVGGDGGFVVMMATYQVTSTTTVGCDIALRLTDVDSPVPVPDDDAQVIALSNTTRATEREQGTMFEVVPAPPGSSLHWGLTGAFSVFSPTQCNQPVSVEGDVSGVYVPFPGDA
jgi:hypothetical protein